MEIVSCASIEPYESGNVTKANHSETKAIEPTEATNNPNSLLVTVYGP